MVQVFGRCECCPEIGSNTIVSPAASLTVCFSEFADKFPSADVLGVDLSPIQPEFVPPNCRFEVDDITKKWIHAEDKFDFIHVRAMTGCIPDWTEFYKTTLRHLKPGGWMEHVELWGIAKSDDESLKPKSPLKTWVDIFEKIGKATGKTFFWGDKVADSAREAGFENVTKNTIKVPIGSWPKDKELKQWGTWNRQFLLEALEGFSIRGLTELLGVGVVPGLQSHRDRCCTNEAIVTVEV